MFRREGTEPFGCRTWTEIEFVSVVKTEVTTESSPIQGLTDLAGKRPSYPSTATSSSSTSSAQGDVEDRRLELGLWRCSHEAGTAENSPLQGLLNCLKEIIVHKRHQPHPSPCKSAQGSTRGDPGQRRLESEDGSSSVEVKTEVTAEDPQDPGLESGPSARPVSKASPPARPSSCSPPSRAEGEAGGRSLFGEGAVKREGAAESSPAQGLLRCWRDVTSPCRPARPACSPSTSSAHQGAEQRGLEPGPWRGPWEEVALEDSPLRGLENCLKDIAVTSPRCSRPPASHGAQRALGERPGRGAGSLAAEEAATEDSPLHGLLSCVTDMAVPSPQHPSLPTCSASTSGAEREPEPRGVEARLWNSSPEEVTPGTSPLHDLANCLQETLVSKSWAPRVLACNAGADVSPRRPATGVVRSWCGDGEPKNTRAVTPWVLSTVRLAGGSQLPTDISTETSPLRGLENCLRDIPVNKPRYPHMPASIALTSPSQRDMGQRRPGVGTRRSLGEDVSTENSPLRGLENCLKDIPVPSRSQSNTPGSRSSLSSSPDPRGRLETAGWRVKTEAGAISEVTPPLQGLENCLKDIPVTRPRGSSATTTYSCTSKVPGEVEQRRPVPRPWRACAAAASAESSPLYGLMNCLKEIPAGRPRYASIPSSYSSSSSADGERDPWGAGPGTWRWGTEELSPENSPLRGLEKCLQEISVPRPQTPSAPATAAVVGSRQGDTAQRRPETGHWDWHGAATVSARVQGPQRCLKALPGTRPSHASRSSPHSTAGCSSPEAGISRFQAEDKRQVENLPGLEDYLEEVTAPRSRPAQSPPSSAQGDAEREEWDVHTRSSGSRDSTAETAHLPGLETCWSAVPVSRCSWASTPLGMSSSSSPRRAEGERGPQPGLCRLHREEVMPADAPRSGPATCPQGTHGNGPGRSNTPSGTSPAHNALGHRRPRRPGTGIKRPYTEGTLIAVRLPTRFLVRPPSLFSKVLSPPQQG
uniref:Uncharacterized protein n=1 Tax=Chrysemys picta bellii TaxID=8478 RepID=A0A8C3HNI8_CHRPI